MALLLLQRCGTTAPPHPRGFGQSDRGNAFRPSEHQIYGLGYQNFSQQSSNSRQVLGKPSTRRQLNPSQGMLPKPSAGTVT